MCHSAKPPGQATHSDNNFIFFKKLAPFLCGLFQYSMKPIRIQVTAVHSNGNKSASTIDSSQFLPYNSTGRAGHPRSHCMGKRGNLLKQEIMKHTCALLLTLAMCLTVCACGEDTVQPPTAEPGQPVTVGVFELTVSPEVLTAARLNTDTSLHDAFLTADTSVGSSVNAASTGYVLAVLSYSVKNTSTETAALEEVAGLVYGSFTYTSANQFASANETDTWNPFTSGTLTHLDVPPGATFACKAYLSLPEEVFSNTAAPLAITLAGYQFSIR